MTAAARIVFLLVFAPACGYPRPDDVSGDLIGGNVHGLWDGADGVMLRLEAGGVETLLTVPGNGTFSFPVSISEGASYAVTVAKQPGMHTCVIDTDGSGTIRGADPVNLAVACRGPVEAIALSGPWGWTFDPSQDTQTFVGSVAVQGVTLAISGTSLTSARVGDAAVTIDEPTAPIALPLGATTVPVALTAGGGLSKTYQLVFDRGGAALEQAVYGKASNTGISDSFGYSVALSGDTLAVGARSESSNATGIDGDQANDDAQGAGAVYVFVRNGATWTQQAYLKASNTEADDSFGGSVALSADTLAVGAGNEDSNATGIDGNQADNTAMNAGAVYVFVRSGTTWSQQAYVKASNTGAGDGFGFQVALSGDTLAVGAPGEASKATGVNPGGGQADNGASGSGAVYVFVRQGTDWAQQAYIKASNAEANDEFGHSVALFDNTLAVGAIGEASGAVGVNPTNGQADNTAGSAGAVYVFVRNGTTWGQQAYVKASNAEAMDAFGSSVALDGDALAVGAVGEASGNAGVNGNELDNSALGAGAAYVFVRNNSSWAQQAYVKASNTGEFDQFGYSVALFGDTLAVGARAEASFATGINGDQSDDAADLAGAVYLFDRSGATWTQRAYVKASNTGFLDSFGISVALARDTLAVGAMNEASGAKGINPANGQDDNSTGASGAVYVFR
jgi:hypothetical protein